MMESREPESIPLLSLQWHHHHKAVVSLLDMLWEKQELVDVTLAAEGQYLQVHRIVLCACSSYFKDVLTQNNNSDKHAIVILKDVFFHDLKALVHYMYKGEVQISEDQLNSFLHTAKSLGIRGLMGGDRDKEKKKKRRHSSSLDSSDEYSCDEIDLPVAPPPPPPPLKHMTSLTKAVEIKIEDSAANARYEPEMSLDLQPDLDSLRNSSISAHELDDGLGLFHCTEDDPGPSKTSDDENNPSGHDYSGYWVEKPPTVTTGSRSSRRVPCPQCHRDYSTHDLMKRHLRYECGVEPQFQCPICLKRTKHKHNLTSHMKTHLKPI